MKELKAEHKRFGNHVQMQSILAELKDNSQVVSCSKPSHDALGGGGYIAYQILVEK